MDPSLIVGIITTAPHGVILSTQACMAHGEAIVTDNLSVIAGWAAVVADRITSTDFISLWSHATDAEPDQIAPFVHACIGRSV